MADGSLVIDVRTDTSKLGKDLGSAEKKLEKFSELFSSQVEFIKELEKELKGARKAYRDILFGDKKAESLNSFKKMESELEAVQAEIKAVESENSKLIESYEKAVEKLQQMKELGFKDDSLKSYVDDVDRLAEQLHPVWNKLDASEKKAKEIAEAMERIRLNPELSQEAQDLKTRMDAVSEAIAQAKTEADVTRKEIEKTTDESLESLSKIKTPVREAVADGVEDFSRFGETIERVAKKGSESLSKLEEPIKKVIEESAKDFSKLDEPIKKFEYTGKTVFGRIAAFLERLKNAIYGTSEDMDKTLKETAKGSEKSVAELTEEGKKNFPKFGNSAREAAKGLGELATKALEGAKAFGKMVFNAAIKGLKKLASLAVTAARSFGHMTINAVKGIGRLVTLIPMAVRGMGNLIKRFRVFNRHSKQASDGVRKFSGRLWDILKATFVFNVISSAMQLLRNNIGALIKTNEKLSSSWNNIKVNLLTAFAPLWETVQPALEAFAKVVERVTYVLASFIAMLSGKTYKQAKDSAEALYDQVTATEELGEAAKKTSKNLQSFDQINQNVTDTAEEAAAATDDTDADGLDFDVEEIASWAEEAYVIFSNLLEKLEPVREALSELYEVLIKLKDAFFIPAAESFYQNFLAPLGSWTLSDEGLPRLIRILKDLLEEVDWERLKTSLDEFWKSLSTFLTNVGTAFLDFGENVAKPVTRWIMSEGLPTFFETLSNIWNSIDWEKLHEALNGLWEAMEPFGRFVADSVISFLKDFLEPVGKWVMGPGLLRFIDILTKFFNDVDWEENTRVVKEFMEELANAAINSGEILLDFLDNVLRPVAAWLAGDFFQEAMSSITRVLRAIDWEKLRTSLQDLWKALEPFGGFVATGIILFMTDFLEPIAKWVVGEAVITFIEGLTKVATDIDWDKLTNSLKDLFDALKPFGSATAQTITGFYNNFLVPIATWTIGEGFVRANEILTDFFNGIDWQKTADSLNVLFTSLSQFTMQAVGGVLDFIERFVAVAANVVIDKAIPSFFEGLAKIMDEIDWEGLRTYLNNLYDSLSKITVQICDGIIWLWEKFFVPAAVWVGNEAVPAILNALTAFFDAVSPLIDAVGEGLIGFYDYFLKPVGTWAGETAVTLIDSLASALTSVGEWAKEHGDKISWVIDHVVTKLAVALLTYKAVTAIDWDVVWSAIANFITYVQNFETVLAAVGDAIKAFIASNWVALLIAGIAAIVTAIVQHANELEEKRIAEAYSNVFGSVNKSVQDLEDIIGSFENADITAFLEELSGLKTNMEENKTAFDNAKASFSDLVEGIATGSTSITQESLPQIAGKVSELFTSWHKTLDGEATYQETFWNGIFTANGTATEVGNAEILKKIKDGYVTKNSEVERLEGEVTAIFAAAVAEQRDLTVEEIQAIYNAMEQMDNIAKEKADRTKRIAQEEQRLMLQEIAEGRATYTEETYANYIEAIKKGEQEAVDAARAILVEANVAAQELLEAGLPYEEYLKLKEEAETTYKNAVTEIYKGSAEKLGEFAAAVDEAKNKEKNAVEAARASWVESQKALDSLNKEQDRLKHILIESGGLTEEYEEKNNALTIAIKEAEEETARLHSRYEELNKEYKELGEEEEKFYQGLLDDIEETKTQTEKDFEKMGLGGSEILSESFKKGSEDPAFKRNIEAVPKNIIDGFEDGLNKHKSRVIEAFGGVSESLLDDMQDRFGIQSPSKVMEENGKYILDGLVGGIDAKLQELQAITNTFINTVIDSFIDRFELRDNVSALTKNFGEVLATSFKTGVDSGIEGIAETVGELIQTVIDKMTLGFDIRDNLSNVFYSLGTTISESLKSSISSATTSVVSTFNDMFNQVLRSTETFANRYLTGLHDMATRTVTILNSLPDAPKLNLPLLNTITIPALAKGGLAYGPTLAMVGDNANASVDPEVIAPLSKIGEMFATQFESLSIPSFAKAAIIEKGKTVELSDSSIAKMVNLMSENIAAIMSSVMANSNGAKSSKISLNIDGREFAELVYDDFTSVAHRRGKFVPIQPFS